LPSFEQIGSSDALWLAREAERKPPLLLLTVSAQDAERLREEIAWLCPALRVHRLPDWEILPYDQFSPHPDLVSERLSTLWQFANGAFDAGIVPVTTALQRLPPRSYLAARTFQLKAREKLDLEALRAQMVLGGYHHVQQVMSPGEFCIRGGLVDLYPTGSAVPYRLDLLGDEIETLRTFDVDSQRSIYPVSEVRMLPAREFPLDEEGRARFRESFRERFEGDPSRSRIYKDVSNSVAPAGVEAYLPLFFESTATLFDYLPKACTLALHRDVSTAINDFWRDIQSRHRMQGGDPDRPLLAPNMMFVPAEEFYVRAKDHPRIDLAEADEPGEGPLTATGLPAVAVDRRAQDPLAALKTFLEAAQLKVMVAAESPGRRETMANYLAEYGLKHAPAASFEQFQSNPASFVLGIAPLAHGFSVPAEGWAIITEAELYAGVVRRRARTAEKRSSVEGMLRDLSELKVGDPVVHEEHGIGRYQGLVTLDLEDGKAEFLLLE